MPELEALRQRAREIDAQIEMKRQEIEEIKRLKDEVQQQVKERLLEAADRFGLAVTFEPPRLRRRTPAAVQKLGIELGTETQGEQDPPPDNTATESAATTEE